MCLASVRAERDGRATMLSSARVVAADCSGCEMNELAGTTGYLGMRPSFNSRNSLLLDKRARNPCQEGCSHD